MIAALIADPAALASMMIGGVFGFLIGCAVTTTILLKDDAK